MLSWDADRSPADWSQSALVQLLSTLPSYRFMHQYLDMMTMRLSGPTSNSRKSVENKNILCAQGDLNSKAGKDANADWGEVSDPTVMSRQMREVSG